MAARDATPAIQADAANGFAGLCAWAAALRWEDIPEAARRRMALIAGDDIAAILSAQDEPEVRAFHAQLTASKGSPEATLLRAGAPRVDARSAALGNGLSASWNELDEGYRRAPCHAGILVLPALLAVAERDGLSVRDTMRAAVGAYEITARFARAWRAIVPPLHPHALYNSVGAAAAVGLARGLDADRLLLALSGAATLAAPGPYAHAMAGALVRNAWPAAGAQNGMLAVDLALAGIGGLASSPQDVFGGCFGGETQAAELTANLGDDWAVCDGYHKVYACAQYSHSALEALDEILRARPALKGGEGVTAIEVETHRLGLMIGDANPATTLAAKFSLPHAVAAALVYGSGGVEAFSSASLAHPGVRRLREAVKLSPHPEVQAWPLDRPGRVTLVLQGGERVSADCQSARGGPDRPFADAEILGKIGKLSRPGAPGLERGVAALAAAGEGRFADWMQGIFTREPK